MGYSWLVQYEDPPRKLLWSLTIEAKPMKSMGF